jgi:hypothetical protein
MNKVLRKTKLISFAQFLLLCYYMTVLIGFPKSSSG